MKIEKAIKSGHVFQAKITIGYAQTHLTDLKKTLLFRAGEPSAQTRVPAKLTEVSRVYSHNPKTISQISP
jgi:hypothetical protein